MEVVKSNDTLNCEVQTLAEKTCCAADILRHTVTTAEDLQKLQRRINRYVQQAKLILTWKRSSGVFKMAGSAAKTAGNVMVLAAPLHPKLGLALKVGHKLWKFGVGLKILNAVGSMLKDLWQTGCRNALVEFTHSTAQLTRNLGLFSEVIHDLQNTAQRANNNNNIPEAPEEIINALRQFVPAHQINYVTHVINIAFGSQYYSPLFDFIATTSDPSRESDMIQLMREIEAFHFTDFVEQSDSKPLVAIGSFLHISRELLDFLDGLQRVTDQDCRFLHECLTKFTQESLTIMKIVSVLTSLDRIRRQQQANSTTSNNVQEITEQSLYTGRDGIRDRQQPLALTYPSASANTSQPSQDNVTDCEGVQSQDEASHSGPVIPTASETPAESCSTLQITGIENNERPSCAEIRGFTTDSNIATGYKDPIETCNESSGTVSKSRMTNIMEQSKIVQGSKLLIGKTFSTMSVAVIKGTCLMTSAVKGIRQSNETETNEVVDDTLIDDSNVPPEESNANGKVQNSRFFIMKTFSTMSMAVNKGSSFMASAVRSVRGGRQPVECESADQFATEAGPSDSNRI